MPPKIVDGNDLRRGKRFADICEKFFPGRSNEAIGEELGGYPESTIRNWKKGGIIGNIALGEMGKLGVSLGCLLTGEENSLALPMPADADDGKVVDIEVIGIICDLQTAFADIEKLLAEAGKCVAAGESLREYDRLPSLINVCRVLSNSLQGIGKRFETYLQHPESRDCPDSGNSHPHHDRTA